MIRNISTKKTITGFQITIKLSGNYLVKTEQSSYYCTNTIRISERKLKWGDNVLKDTKDISLPQVIAMALDGVVSIDE